MSRCFQSSEGLLVLPRLRVQNANAISSPLTHGFPSMTAFFGLMWALERKLANTAHALYLDSVGVVCHSHDEQVTDDGYVRKFRLTRNPVDNTGSTAAIVEEGRMHMEISLIFGVSDYRDNNVLQSDDAELSNAAQHITDIVAGMRIAGGSVLPSSQSHYRNRPQLFRLAVDDAEALKKQFRKFCRLLLPGFALVSRQDLLQQRLIAMQSDTPDTTLLDAWLDLSRFNYRPEKLSPTTPEDINTDLPKASDKVTWAHDRNQGWIVPIPIGYAALTPLAAPGEISNLRDSTTSARFVESIYSMGQWLGAHRLREPKDLLWYADYQPDTGIYQCCNDFAVSNEVT